MAIDRESINESEVLNSDAVVGEALRILSSGREKLEVQGESPSSLSGPRFAVGPVRIAMSEDGEVTIPLGDMKISYVDPFRPTLTANKSVPDEVIAATSCLFKTKMELTRVRDEEERRTLRGRQRRMEGMLEEAGRMDVLKVGLYFGRFPVRHDLDHRRNIR